MAGEGIVTSTVLFACRHTDFFHVPLGLAALSMHGALAVRESMRRFEYHSRPAGECEQR